MLTSIYEHLEKLATANAILLEKLQQDGRPYSPEMSEAANAIGGVGWQVGVSRLQEVQSAIEAAQADIKAKMSYL